MLFYRKKYDKLHYCIIVLDYTLDDTRKIKKKSKQVSFQTRDYKKENRLVTRLIISELCLTAELP